MQYIGMQEVSLCWGDRFLIAVEAPFIYSNDRHLSPKAEWLRSSFGEIELRDA